MKDCFYECGNKRDRRASSRGRNQCRRRLDRCRSSVVSPRRIQSVWRCPTARVSIVCVRRVFGFRSKYFRLVCLKKIFGKIIIFVCMYVFFSKNNRAKCDMFLFIVNNRDWWKAWYLDIHRMVSRSFIIFFLNISKFADINYFSVKSVKYNIMWIISGAITCKTSNDREFGKSKTIGQYV